MVNGCRTTTTAADRGAQGERCLRLGGSSGRLTWMSTLAKVEGPAGAFAIVGALGSGMRGSS